MIWKNVRERKGLYMGLTHFDENGKAVMVDVTDKKETAREAVAEGKILVNRDVFQAVKAGQSVKATFWLLRQRRVLQGRSGPQI